jgi:hypothetical protein
MVSVVRLMRLGAFAVALLIGLASATAGAQSQQQLEVFRSLTPEQQRQILEQASSDTTTGAPPAPAAATSRPKESAGQAIESLGAVEMVTAEPRLRAGDTLLLTITVPES